MISPIPPLLLLKEAWARRDLILAGMVVGLLALAKRQQEAIGGLRELLAAKPRVEIREIVKTVEKRVVGPVRIVEKIKYLPGGEKIVERVIERAAVSTDRGAEMYAVRVEVPVCPKERATRWYVGGGLSPGTSDNEWAARGGLTFKGRFDLGYRYSWRAPHHGAEAALRF